MIVGGIGERRARHVKDELVPVWASVLGDDSRDVWKATAVSVVRSPKKSGEYLAKYMLKNWYDRVALEEKGFIRRWSRSRNWPGGQVQLRGTVEGGWEEVLWHPGQKAVEAESPPNPLLERVGDDMAVELAGRRQRQ